MAHSATWRGAALFQRDDWEVRLSAEDLAALEHALATTRGLPLEELSSRPLELANPKFAAIRETLETGSGAALVRKIPVERYVEEDLGRLFFTIGAQVGTPVSQSALGEKLLHVRDEAFGKDDPRIRGPYTNKRLSFHTDRCDVIAFLCVRPASAGGENHVVSSMTLHDELRRRRPDALRVLEEPFAYLRHTVDTGNDRPFTLQPIFSEYEGHFAASFLRVLIDRADREPGVPDLTAEQREALDTLEDVAEDPALYASFRLEPGDVLFLNNWVTFHRRTAFVDGDEGRHLMRLWLSVPNSRPLDPRFAGSFGPTDAGSVRGGMRAE